MMVEENMLELMKAGITASSPDNSQPWHMLVAGDRIQLGLDQSRLGMFFDPAMAASLLSCGGVCELIRIAASGYGMTTEISLFPGSEQPLRIAELSFHRTDAAADPLLDGIWARSTHRGHYHRWQQVGPEHLARAAEAALQVAGHRVIWMTGTNRPAATRLVYKADALRFSHQQVYEQFFHTLRFGADAARSNDGLAANTLGIERIVLPVLRLLAPWSVGSKLNRLGLNHVMAARGASRVRHLQHVSC